MPAGKAAAPKKNGIIAQIKIIDVVRYIALLVYDLIGGRTRLLRDPKDYVKRLLGIVWPSFIAPLGSPDSIGRGEIFGLLMLSVLRTLIMDISSGLVRQLTAAVYSRKLDVFRSLVGQSLQLAAVAAVINSLVGYCKDRLIVVWRAKLTQEIHRKYFSHMNYYYIGTTKKPKPIPHADELIIREVNSSSGRLVSLVHLLIKGIVPIFWFTFKLVRSHGVAYAMIPHMYLLLAYELAQRLFPKNIGFLWRNQAKAIGGYFSATTRIQTHSEAIAALGGSATEGAILAGSYGKVSSSALELHRTRAKHDLIFKLAYTYGCKSWIQSFILYPILARTDTGASPGSLVSSVEHSSELMLEMLIGNGNLLTLHATAQHMIPSCSKLCELLDTLSTLTTEHGSARSASMLEGNEISFKDVDVYTPTGQLLVRNLTFQLTPGEALLLTGHNGAGKSSIFRCLGGLWPLKQGTITKPGAETDGLCADIFYVPQKPYNVLGSLEDQLTYPKTREHISREKMVELLTKVDLLHLLNDTSVTNWDERLSLGEQQRLAMARLFYHSPKYAILDECTSAVSHDVERMLYEECFKRDISYITICHRPALEAYHTKNLHLKGEGSNGGWEVRDLPPRTLTGKNHDIDLSVPVPESKADKRPLPKRSFMSKIVKLLGIVLPGSTFTTLALLASILGRTALFEIGTIATGKLLKASIDMNRKKFIQLALLNAGQDIVAASLECLVGYLQNCVSVQWHDALARHAQKLYLANNAFYRVKNIDGRVSDPDQRMTQEIEDLAEHLSAILSKSILPFTNLLWLGYRMHQLMKNEQLLPMYGYIALVSAVVKLFMPDHETLVRLEQNFEAQFRFVHNRLRNHSESIAFFGGGTAEQAIADGKLQKLVDQQLSTRRQEAFFKAVSLCLMRDQDDESRVLNASSVFSLFLQLQVAAAGGSSAEVLNAVSKGITQSIDSFGKLAGLFGSVSKLSGASTRVCELFDVMENLPPPTAATTTGDSCIIFDDVDIVTPTQRTIASHLAVRIQPGKSLLVTGPNGVGKTSFFRVLAGLWDAHGITKPLDGVSLVPQKLYMVTGTLAAQVMYPDMPGKTRDEATTKRILDCLEKVGILRLATRERCQVLDMDPAVVGKVKAAKRDLEQGCKVKVTISPAGVVSLNGVAGACADAIHHISDKGCVKVTVKSDVASGLDATDRWEHVLSLGEQQRLGIARILYHAPKYAVLDECTDAVSMEVEKSLYTQIKEANTTCITISKRLALPEFHSQQLELGAGNANHWTLHDLHTE